MAYVMPETRAGKGGKGKVGRKSFQAGEPLQDLMLLHRKSVKKYLAVPACNDSGSTSAMFEGISCPQTWVSPALLAEKLSIESTELLNRLSLMRVSARLLVALFGCM